MTPPSPGPSHSPITRARASAHTRTQSRFQGALAGETTSHIDQEARIRLRTAVDARDVGVDVQGNVVGPDEAQDTAEGVMVDVDNEGDEDEDMPFEDVEEEEPEVPESGSSSSNHASTSSSCGPPPPSPPSNGSGPSGWKGKGKENVPPKGEEEPLPLDSEAEVGTGRPNEDGQGMDVDEVEDAGDRNDTYGRSNEANIRTRRPVRNAFQAQETRDRENEHLPRTGTIRIDRPEYISDPFGTNTVRSRPMTRGASSRSRGVHGEPEPEPDSAGARPGPILRGGSRSSRTRAGIPFDIPSRAPSVEDLEQDSAGDTDVEPEGDSVLTHDLGLGFSSDSIGQAVHGVSDSDPNAGRAKRRRTGLRSVSSALGDGNGPASGGGSMPGVPDVEQAPATAAFATSSLAAPGSRSGSRPNAGTRPTGLAGLGRPSSLINMHRSGSLSRSNAPRNLTLPSSPSSSLSSASLGSSTSMSSPSPLPLTRSLSLSASATGRTNRSTPTRTANASTDGMRAPAARATRRPSNALGRSQSFASAQSGNAPSPTLSTSSSFDGPTGRASSGRRGSAASVGTTGSIGSVASGTTGSAGGARRGAKRQRNGESGTGRDRGMSVSSVRSVGMRSECGTAPISSSSSSSAASSPYFSLPSPSQSVFSTLSSFPFTPPGQSSHASFPFHYEPSLEGQGTTSATDSATAASTGNGAPATPPAKVHEEDEMHKTPKAGRKVKGHFKTPSMGVRPGLRSSGTAQEDMEVDSPGGNGLKAPVMSRTSSSEEITALQGLTLTPTRSGGHRHTGSRTIGTRTGGQPLSFGLAAEQTTPSLSASSSSPSTPLGEDEAMVITPDVTPTKTPSIARPGRRGRDSARSRHTSEDEDEDEVAVSHPKDLFPGVAKPDIARLKPMDGYKALKMLLRCSGAGATESERPQDVFGTPPPNAAADMIIGREEEKATVWQFLRGPVNSAEDVAMDGATGLTEASARALYLSGAPGTGKTALVNSLAGRLNREQGWQVAMVNCMGLAGRSGEEVWKRIVEGWGMEVRGRQKAEKAVDEGLSAQAGNAGAGFLLVLDEIDALIADGPSKTTGAASSQLVKTLFTLAYLHPSTQIRVIAISNSLDLTSRHAIASVLGDRSPHTLNFQSYGSKEMIEIVKARVGAAASAVEPSSGKPVEVDAKAIELVGRKVEASNGDLRACLGVMVEAVAVAEAEWRKKRAAAGPSMDVVQSKVSLPHVLKALASFNKLRTGTGGASGGSSGNGSSSLVGKVKALGLQVRIILLSLLIARKRNSLGLRPVHTAASSLYGSSGPNASPGQNHHVSAETLYPTYTYLLSHASSPIAPASQTDFMDLMMQAEVMGVLSVESAGSSPTKIGGATRGRARGGKGKERTMELLMNEDDLKLALGLSESSANNGSVDATDSEVRTLWLREESRWTKATDQKQRNAEEVKRKAAQGPLGFDE